MTTIDKALETSEKSFPMRHDTTKCGDDSGYTVPMNRLNIRFTNILHDYILFGVTRAFIRRYLDTRNKRVCLLVLSEIKA